jgi:hypothetical protein
LVCKEWRRVLKKVNHRWFVIDDEYKPYWFQFMRMTKRMPCEKIICRQNVGYVFVNPFGGWSHKIQSFEMTAGVVSLMSISELCETTVKFVTLVGVKVVDIELLQNRPKPKLARLRMCSKVARIITKTFDLSDVNTVEFVRSKGYHRTLSDYIQGSQKFRQVWFNQTCVLSGENCLFQNVFYTTIETLRIKKLLVGRDDYLRVSVNFRVGHLVVDEFTGGGQFDKGVVKQFDEYLRDVARMVTFKRRVV